MEIGFRPNLYMNAAECYQKGSDTQAAIRRLEECAQEFPRTGGLWLKLAGLYLSSPLTLDLEKVRECLRKEEEIDPAFGEDPRTSIALILGEWAGPSLPVAVRKVAGSNPAELQITSALVARHWPAFQSLDEETRKEWIGAALLLWGSSPAHFARRRIAGQFAEIAEVQRRAPKLQNWDVRRASWIVELRNKSSHPGGEISEQEAIQIYDLSGWLISQLAAN
jgi:tetratricopeptide (TPR) repeat protein